MATIKVKINIWGNYAAANPDKFDFPCFTFDAPTTPIEYKSVLYVQLTEKLEVSKVSFTKIDSASLFYCYELEGESKDRSFKFTQVWRSRPFGIDDSLLRKLEPYISAYDCMLSLDAGVKNSDHLRYLDFWSFSGFNHEYAADKNKDKNKAALNKIKLVNDRLDLVDHLMSVKVDNDTEDWHIYNHYVPLCIYLSLTCFDVLGSREDWLGFNEWLSVNKKKKKNEYIKLEQENICNGISSNEDPIRVTKALKEGYDKLYGVKSSFKSFINEFLSGEAKSDLLNTIRICEKNLKTGVDVFANEEKKVNYLYEVRNSYTHSAHYTFDIHPSRLERSEVGWQMRQQIINNDYWKEYMTLNWPSALYQAACKGLAEYIKRLRKQA